MTAYGHNSGDRHMVLAEEFRQKAREHAEAQGRAEYWDEWKKIVFSEIVNQQQDMAVSKAEHVARSSPEYRKALKNAIDWGTKANVLKAELKSIEMEFETWRTTEATRRSEMNLR